MADVFNRERQFSYSSLSEEEEQNHELKEEEQNLLILRSGHQYSTVPKRRESPPPGGSGYLEPIPTNQQTKMPVNPPELTPPDPPLPNAAASTPFTKRRLGLSLLTRVFVSLWEMRLISLRENS